MKKTLDFSSHWTKVVVVSSFFGIAAVGAGLAQLAEKPIVYQPVPILAPAPKTIIIKAPVSIEDLDQLSTYDIYGYLEKRVKSDREKEEAANGRFL